MHVTTPDTIIFKVKKDCNVRKNATALVGHLKEGKPVILQAVGAGAVNQAVKISVQARSEIARIGRDLILRPGMFNISNKSEVAIDSPDVLEGNGELTVVVLNLEVR